MPTEALRQVTLDRSAIADAVLLSDEAGWNQTAKDWQAFLALGQLRSDQHRTRDAVAAFSRAASLDQADFAVQYAYGMALADDWRRRAIVTRAA